MCAKTINELTPEQMERAIMANSLQLAGFTDASSLIVDRLRREVRPVYGSFKLNEADECALEPVERADLREWTEGGRGP